MTTEPAHDRPRDRGARATCTAVIVTDDRERAACPKTAQPGRPYCPQHTGPLSPMKPASADEFFSEWRAAIETALAKRLGDDGLDRDAHDPDLVRALIPVMLPLYSLYWRVDVFGIENIPTEGPALLAANHSGTIPIDGAMLKLAVLKEHGRNPWLLAADLVFRIPGFRDLVRIAGNARADREETLDLMRKGELLGVFPEGFKGIGKGWKKRYQLQRFGRGGFVEVCIETGAPIIPTAIIGAEEAYPMIGNLNVLARRFGIPYFPITPTWPLLGPLGALPLPSKWIIAFGEPIPTIQHGPKAVNDTQLVLEITEQVRQTVQHLVNRNLIKRRRAFF
ncbi:MAG TPA: lysophospholipid acyltransferase family protein [Actinomycetota bacterium]|nr:lysophospholipid acyltransferase family protein [Actinomycetota bacterium]